MKKILLLILFIYAISFADSAMLYFTAPGGHGMIGKAAGYVVHYWPDSLGPINTELKWAQATEYWPNNHLINGGYPIPSPAGQTDSILITGLTPGRSYYFVIKAWNSDLIYSPLSESIRLPSRPIKPPVLTGWR